MYDGGMAHIPSFQPSSESYQITKISILIFHVWKYQTIFNKTENDQEIITKWINEQINQKR